MKLFWNFSKPADAKNGKLSLEPAALAMLTDVLERLPAMTNQHDLTVLLPANWQPAAAANKPLRETCPA